MEAVRAMKEGKKVRRPFMKDNYLRLQGSLFYNEDGDDVSDDLDLYSYEAIDWEIVDEDKDFKLSDLTYCEYGTDLLSVTMVKKCRDLILRKIHNGMNPKDAVNETFGDLK